MFRWLVAAGFCALLAPLAHAETDDLPGRAVIFQHGASLVKTDAKGKGETKLVTLAAGKTVRALRTDAAGKVLLADVSGTWSYMPLDGSATALTDLPCGAGPASLAEDGLCVLCRAKAGTGAQLITLKTGKSQPVDVPMAAGTRISGIGAARRILWTDSTSVFSAPPLDKTKAEKVAGEAPLRQFSASPDGARALGVYADYLFDGPKKKVAADVLMMFALDGIAARRKAIANGVPVEWSHDSKWVLVQDAGARSAGACIMAATGGQYKCWRGFTALAISPDGKYALVLGGKTKSEPKKAKKATKSKKAPAPKDDQPAPGAEAEGEGEGSSEPAPDEVPLPPPNGPLALYRAQLDGAFSTRPVLVASDVTGAAVWLPATP